MIILLKGFMSHIEKVQVEWVPSSSRAVRHCLWIIATLRLLCYNFTFILPSISTLLSIMTVKVKIHRFRAVLFWNCSSYTEICHIAQMPYFSAFAEFPQIIWFSHYCLSILHRIVPLTRTISNPSASHSPTTLPHITILVFIFQWLTEPFTWFTIQAHIAFRIFRTLILFVSVYQMAFTLDTLFFTIIMERTPFSWCLKLFLRVVRLKLTNTSSYQTIVIRLWNTLVKFRTLKNSIMSFLHLPAYLILSVFI